MRMDYWRLFLLHGSVEAYLLYRQMERETERQRQRQKQKRTQVEV